MPAKGSSARGCCCDGCEQEPTIWGDTGYGFKEQQVWRRYCCSCVPKYACVSISDSNGQGGSAVYKLHCPPLADEGFDQALYSGPTIGVAGVATDLTFHFRTSGEACYFCVESVALGIDQTTPYACIDVTPALRAQQWCRSLLIDGVPTTFEVDGYTIAISAGQMDGTRFVPMHEAIHNRRHCYDSYGNLILDNSTLREACCRCSCICRCMCLTISGDGPVIQEIACMDNGSWYFYQSGVVIGLVADSYGVNCELQIISYGNLVPVVEAAGVLVGSVGNPCPRPDATFNVIVEPTDHNGINHTVVYDVRCAGCAGCSITISACCVATGRTEFPSVIYADVNPSCAGCADFTMELAWDQSISQYVGSQSVCGGRVITLSTGCPFTTLNFSGTPCVSGSDSDPYATCDPIDGTFEITTGGINCCPGQLFGGVSFSVHLYE